ncbi:MAG: rRNA maturation RNase YbeY [Bacteroidetes bacterium GWF2_42_66]|nr:MAG: rRNA maturation RNase YbeY [Bacteroidetes bacterium GWA2_42_15]OFX97955.1 MAG: rRNA maturation RNase YbeY [Bacteroidetes bacterium GWE2_42_39]OFY45808.1 MAG: rRNA maturation RNase YbeY [Bacteroidetes bacterium GWF2_42_66]
MSINFYKEDFSGRIIDQKKRKNWINFAIEKEKFKCGDLSFIFCFDEYLLKINKEYLNHDYYTDIITFNYVEGNIISGDIFISIDRVRDNAQQYGVSFENELSRVIIHGVLHLIGFDDKDESSQSIMRMKEDEYLLELSKF